MAAYQVFAGSLRSDGSLADISWGAGVDGEALLSELAELELDGAAPFSEATDARAISEAIALAAHDDERAGLCEAVAQAASRHLTQGTPFSGREAGSSTPGLDEGYYVVVSTSCDDGAHSLIFPTLIAVGRANTELTPKEAAPSVEKQVLEDSTGEWGSVADAETGQEVSFRIKATLPEPFMNRSHLSCRIVDELPSGMDLDMSSLSVFCDGADVSGLFGVSLEDGTLVLEAAELAGSGLPQDCAFVVSYTARLTGESLVGAQGSVNSARLEVEADGKSCATPESKTALFTYGLSVSKVDAADYGRTLPGARFLLGREGGLFAVVRDGHVVSWTTSKDEATPLATDAEGRFAVAGLDSDDYTLTELEAPDGYQKRGGDIPLSIQSALAFDVADGAGRIESLSLVSDSSSSSGDTSEGKLFCAVENVRSVAQTVPSTGDAARSAWPFALLGAGCVGSAFCARKRFAGLRRRRAARMLRVVASVFVALMCLSYQGGCLPIKALAQDRALAGEPTSEEAAGPDGTLGLIVGSDGGSRSATRLRSPSASGLTAVDSEADIPRNTSNSYINVLNMSAENAYVMVNDTANFGCTDNVAANTYINWCFSEANFREGRGTKISDTVLYKGAAGSNESMWAIDTVTDRTGNGLVAVWFKDAGILSDTGEPVSMLLKLKQYQIMPNYKDYYRVMSGSTTQRKLKSYRQFRSDGGTYVPVLYVFPSDNVDQTRPENVRVLMCSVWSCSQYWEVSFYRSSQTPTRGSGDSGYSLSSLGLSQDQLVTTATNGNPYLARQYCYDLDVTGIRWLNPSDGSYSATSPYNDPNSSSYGLGGAYLASAGAESFGWLSGNSGATYVSSASNLKSGTSGSITYWLHDENHSINGIWYGERWESPSEENELWENAIASDILSQSSFGWIGTGCSTGLNLNSQFTGTGTLRLNKAVEGGSTQAFPFKVTFESPSYASGTLSWRERTESFAYTVRNANDAILSRGNLRSGDTVNLANGQTLVVEEIPEGTRYTIVESSHAGYQPVLLTDTSPIVGDTFVGTVMNGLTSNVNVANAKMLSPANWTIVKAGNYGEKIAGAQFTVCYYAGNDATGTPTRSWTLKTDSAGRASLDASHLVSGDEFYTDSRGTIGLPVGTVTIKETLAPSGYVGDDTVYSYRITDAGGTLSSTIPNTLTVTNRRLTGKLSVSKAVRGTGADANLAFSFAVRIVLGGTPLSGTLGGTVFSDGWALFSLKDGQTKTFSDLPAGARYEVYEAEVAGYAVSWSKQTGSIVANATVTATATNTYSASGEARLELTKAYDSNGPGLKNRQFAFELHEGSPSGTVLARASCSADGKIRFDLSLDQNLIGQTRNYYVTEVNDGQPGVTYDTHAAKVDVRVTNNGDGTLGAEVSYTDATFTNVYRKYLLPDAGLGGVVGPLAAGTALTAGAAWALARTSKRRRFRR